LFDDSRANRLRHKPCMELPLHQEDMATCILTGIRLENILNQELILAREGISTKTGQSIHIGQLALNHSTARYRVFFLGLLNLSIIIMYKVGHDGGLDLVSMLEMRIVIYWM
jgi:hypothetical protein